MTLTQVLVLITILFLTFWLICSILSAGLWFAYMQRKFKTIRVRTFKNDQKTILKDLIGGPVALLATIYCLYDDIGKLSKLFQYGWLWPWSQKAYIEAHGGVI